jgi:hypothetical protein
VRRCDQLDPLVVGLALALALVGVRLFDVARDRGDLAGA